MKPLILGSQSPRRKEILSYFSYPFKQASPDFCEESIPFENDPIAYVCTLSNGKSASLVQEFPNSVIITADTIVYKDNKVYGKPADEKDGQRILTALSGQWHSVYTAVTVRENEHFYCGFEETKVLFNSISQNEIESYYRQLHCIDKAGSYAVQMSGGLIVRKIEGCYTNVMGLPINTLRNLLQHVGIDLWNYLA
jgi:septum formation protein